MQPQADCKDLLMCAYSLTSAETDILRYLLEKKEARVEEIAEKMDKDKSTVYRSLQKLVGCRLVLKEKRIIKQGGYFYVYKALSKEDISKNLKACADQWHDRMVEIADNFKEEEESDVF